MVQPLWLLTPGIGIAQQGRTVPSPLLARQNIGPMDYCRTATAAFPCKPPCSSESGEWRAVATFQYPRDRPASTLHRTALDSSHNCGRPPDSKLLPMED